MFWAPVLKNPNGLILQLLLLNHFLYSNGLTLDVPQIHIIVYADNSDTLYLPNLYQDLYPCVMAPAEAVSVNHFATLIQTRISHHLSVSLVLVSKC